MHTTMTEDPDAAVIERWHMRLHGMSLRVGATKPFASLAFPKTGLLLKRLFGWRVASGLYSVWACVRCAYESTIRNDYWRSAFWFKPFAEDGSGRTVPYYSYSAVAYLERLDWSGKTICEIGGGYSTTWWSDRAKRVITFDIDAKWINYDKRPNVNAVLVPSYNEAVSDIPRDADVYIIDNSGDRDPIVSAVIDRALAGSIVILDNAECFPASYRSLISRCKLWVVFAGYAPGQIRDETLICWM